MNFELSSLDDYSRRFAELLFAAFPDWSAFASIEEGCLVVKVPAPIVGPQVIEEDVLSIVTDEEVKLEFDRYRVQFDTFSEVPEEEAFAQAVEFIRALVEEKTCIVISMREGRLRGCTTVEAGKEPNLAGFDSADTVYIRSWNGTYNRVLFTKE